MSILNKAINVIGMLVVLFLAFYFAAWMLNKVLEQTTKEELIYKTLNYNSIALDKYDKELKSKAFDTEMILVVVGVLLLTIVININDIKKFKYKNFPKGLISMKIILLLLILLTGIPLKMAINEYALNNPETPLKDLNISKWIIYIYIIVVIALKNFITKFYDITKEKDFKKMNRNKQFLAISIFLVFALGISFYLEEIVKIIGPLGIEFSYSIVEMYKKIGLL